MAQRRRATPLHLQEQAAPATPPAGVMAVYPKTDGLPYAKNDDGTEMVLHDPDAELFHWMGL